MEVIELSEDEDKEEEVAPCCCVALLSFSPSSLTAWTINWLLAALTDVDGYTSRFWYRSGDSLAVAPSDDPHSFECAVLNSLEYSFLRSVTHIFAKAVK